MITILTHDTPPPPPPPPKRQPEPVHVKQVNRSRCPDGALDSFAWADGRDAIGCQTLREAVCDLFVSGHSVYDICDDLGMHEPFVEMELRAALARFLP